MGWGLPPEAELAFLEQVHSEVLKCDIPPGVIRKCLEITLPDINGCSYSFYGRIVAEVIGSDIVLKDCDFDPIP